MFKIKKEKMILAQPGQTLGSVEHVTGVARENLTWLLVGLSVFVVVGAAVGGFIWMKQQEDRLAEDLLHEGMRVYSQSSPVAPPPRADQLHKAVDTFRKVMAQYPRSSAAAQASYMLGNALSDLKDWEGASKAYQEFLTRYGDHQALVPLVYQRLAYSQLLQGKLDEAQRTLDTILRIPGAPNKDHALFELAKINETLNRPEGALTQYQELLKNHPHSPYAEEASVRIKTLDIKNAATTLPQASTPVPAPTPPAAATPPGKK
jgi:tetratricopeptide (TPR) repeat protein